MKNDKISIAQIGCGYWGPNLLRNFNSIPNCTVKYVFDPDEGRRSFVTNNYPNINAIDNLDIIVDDYDIDAVVISTPAKTHFELASKFLSNHKDVLIEKPIATNVKEVDELIELANQNNRIIMAGHTFIYNDAVRYVKNLIDNGDLGDIRYINCQRLNLGRIRSDIDALWNFAPHDISIIQYWLGNIEPLFISRSGMDYYQKGVEDVTFLNLTYPKKIMANIHVSWLDPVKVRKITVVGTEKMVVYDDVAEDKISIYDKGIDIQASLGNQMDFDDNSIQSFQYRSGDLLVPKIKFNEPLNVETSHFIDCVKNRITPITDVEHARSVVKILEQADK